MSKKALMLFMVLVALAGGVAALIEGTRKVSATDEGSSSISGASIAETVYFHDLESQMPEFMGYYESIELTSEQEAIKEDVLGDEPAACCHNSSALTCCCPCNISKSLWGLANYLIAEKGMEGAELEATLDEWMTFANPSGYTGDACYTGGCEKSPREGGCGGMDDERIVV